LALLDSQLFTPEQIADASALEVQEHISEVDDKNLVGATILSFPQS
jgi:hypothetical protein